MVKKLQTKFIAIAMLSIIVVTGSIFTVIIINNYTKMNTQLDGIINLIAENDGKIPEYRPRNGDQYNLITKETQFSTRYFTINVDESGNIVASDVNHIAAVNTEEAEKMAKEILENYSDVKIKSGYYGNYRYKIVQKDNQKDKMIIFLDSTVQLNNLNFIIKQSTTIMLIGFVVVFICVSILSKRALKPMIENIEKQKQFITNAGHELKTPVAVIIADTDVLDMTANEESKEWVQSIRNQAARLNVLIKSLLNLANLEEKGKNLNYSKFSMTSLITQKLEELKAVSKNKKIEYNPPKDVEIYADKNSMDQLITILLDNALKYTDNNGLIRISVEDQGKSIRIQFSNTCDKDCRINTRKMFDRFYRGDSSRSKEKEGYGIGLSMAKSIVELHKGKIWAEYTKDGMICFNVVI